MGLQDGVVEEEAEELAEDEQVKLMPFPYIYNIGGSIGEEYQSKDVSTNQFSIVSLENGASS